MGHELEGAILTRIRRRGFDRVVEMRWETPDGKRRTSLVELLGRSANLLLLDEDERVLGFARRIASAFRAPVVGVAYRPPVPRPEMEGFTWDPSRVGEYLNRFGAGSAVVELLNRLSPALGEDFASDPEAAGDPEGRLEEILAAVAEGRLEPTLYTSAPPEEVLTHPARYPEVPILSPFPLVRPPRAAVTRFSEVEAAVRTMSEVLDAQGRDRETRERVASALRREEARQNRLALKLQEELHESERAESLQRFAELILAHPEAQVEGGVISVRDLYDPGEPTIEIPADPALSARENAEKLFSRARKLRRGGETIRGRMGAVESKLESLAARRKELEEAEAPKDLEELEKHLEADRLLPARTARGDRRPREAESEAGSIQGIRKYRTEQGFVILVGKTSHDNDRLTFQVASPHDFWFHAAGRSGAHVVVRNPSRLKELPPPVALSAARIAAHFSRARGGKVEVHYTMRKHVRKGRRFGPGQVSIRNYRTLEVEPGIPGSEEEG